MNAGFGSAIFSRNLSVNMPHMFANQQMLFLLKHSNPVARLPLTQAVHLTASHPTLIPRGKEKNPPEWLAPNAFSPSESHFHNA